MTTGRIDLHTHLLPNVDDGCRSYADAVQCARVLVDNGFTHAVCSSHIWPSLPSNTVENIRHKTDLLQGVIHEAKVPLKVVPGGELNLVALWPALQTMRREEIPTIGHLGHHILFDFWAEELPEDLEPAVGWVMGKGFEPILAHPERIGAFRNDPDLLERVGSWGVHFQLNAWCLVDPPGSLTRVLAERWLGEDRYLVMATDLHNPAGMRSRMDGITRAIELVGEPRVRQLTEDIPRKLLNF